MKKSTSVIFAFVFFLTLLSVQTGKGIGIDFRFFSEIERVDGTDKTDIKKVSDTKSRDEEKKLLLGSSKTNDRVVDPVLKSVNVGVELTKALFGKYLKKTE